MTRASVASCAAAAASGAMLGALFPSLGWDWMSWFALVPLFIAVARAKSGRQALWCGYLAGVVFFAVSCPWIATTIHNYGDLSSALAGFVFILFLLLMGSYLGMFAWAGYWIGRRLNHRLLPLPFAWVGVELLRTYTPMGGFPWNLLGYAQYQHAGFMLLAPITGIYGVSLVIALANTLLAALLLRWWRRGVPSSEKDGRGVLVGSAVGLGLILALATFPYHPPEIEAATLRARLVQPNTALGVDWTAEALTRFLAQQELLSAPAGGAAVQLIVWPEQPAPLNFDLEPGLQQMTARLLDATHAAFLLGEVSYPLTAAGAPDYSHPRNSALLINADGTTGPRYDKMHLVPFGEYVPLPGWIARIGGVGKLVQDVGDFVPGKRTVLFPLAGHSFATMICYESIFPELARGEVRNGAEWLVNQSDDSWYGRSSAAAQGLMMAQVRAMENRRWLLRVTDNGLTAVVDPYGRITAELPRFTAAALEASFAPRSATTFYTRHGDWIAYLSCLIVLAMALKKGNSR